MSKDIPYTITNESVTVVWEGRSVVVRSGSPNYLALKAALHNKQWDDISKYITIPKSIESWSNDRFTIVNGKVSYRGEELPSDINSRIIAMASNGEDPTPLFKFWERLQRNPSFRSVEQLYRFLQHENIPITPDGCFLAYKKVNPNYTDVYTGTIFNHPGVTNEMPRNKISDDPRVDCHYGYHVGALLYAQEFKPANGRLIVCKIDPENVVCVPYDNSQRKMRVCKYTVVGNHGTELPSTVFTEALPTDAQEEDQEDSTLSAQPDIEDETAARESVSTLPVARAIKSRKLNKKTKQLIAKLDKLELPGLMEYSLEELRQYATYGVEIVGASKIPGGKVALVERILKAR